MSPSLPLPAATRFSENKPLIYLSAGIHGDEPAGPLALLQLMQEEVFDERASWMICPMLNPTGLAAQTRENKDHIDLNRDYLQKETHEVRAHIKWLGTHPKPDLFFSFHEDWESTGFYFYEINTHSTPSAVTRILEASSSIIPVEPALCIDDHPVTKPGWIYRGPDADFPNQWPESIYLAKNGTPLSYTFETPSSLEMEKRIACHKKALNQALNSFFQTQ